MKASEKSLSTSQYPVISRAIARELAGTYTLSVEKLGDNLTSWSEFPYYPLETLEKVPGLRGDGTRETEIGEPMNGQGGRIVRART